MACAGTGQGAQGAVQHLLAALLLSSLLCTGAYAAAPTERPSFAARFVVTSAAFKSPGPAAASACVLALKAAAPGGARADVASACVAVRHRALRVSETEMI